MEMWERNESTWRKLWTSNDGAYGTNGGYTKQPDGTLIQWGAVTVAQGAYTASVAYPQAFTNKNQVSITLTPTSAGTSYNVNWDSSTATSLSIGRTPNATANTYYYQAIGRWK